MISIIALLTTVAATGAVTEVSIAPVADRTEVVIRVDGGVNARDFMLDDGRLVIDLEGTQARASRWTDINRGGVRAVRVAQFQPGVARVVLELGTPVTYEVTYEADAVRVSFANATGAFQPWSSAGGAARPAAPAQGTPLLGTPAGQPAPAPSQQAAPVQQRPQQPQPPRPGTVAQPSNPLPQRPQAQPITVTFDQVPVPDVLASFAAIARRSIIPSPDVRSQTITAEIVNQPWDVALEAILEANHLSMRELRSGVMIVESGSATALRTQTEPLESRQFTVQYVSADSLQSAIAGLLTKDGKVSVNRASNAILVTDTRSALDRIGPMVEGMDVRTAQVNISARIAFVNRTSLEQLGFVYDLKDSRGSQLGGVVTNFIDANGNGIFEPEEAVEEGQDVILLGGNSIAALGNANNRVQQPTLRLALSLILGRHTLVSFLEALQTVSLTDVQASPVVTTLDHRAARIQVGQETPVRVIDLGSQTGGQAAPRSTIEYKQTGVILTVTPHVTGDLVMMEIQAERSQVQPGPSDAGVVFETSNAQTQVLVEDGATAVIAGLTETQKIQQRTGIPILMDLPVVGKLFRRTSEEEIQRDLLIMVTPHIVRN